VLSAWSGSSPPRPVRCRGCGRRGTTGTPGPPGRCRCRRRRMR